MVQPMILEKLSDSLQTEVLHYIEFLSPAKFQCRPIHFEVVMPHRSIVIGLQNR